MEKFPRAISSMVDRQTDMLVIEASRKSEKNTILEVRDGG